MTNTRASAPFVSAGPSPDAVQMTSKVPLARVTRLLPSVGRLTLAVVLVGLAWRAGRYAMGFPIWGDEAFVAVNFVDRDFAGMLQPPLEYGQIVPLGFMWAQLAVKNTLGASEWSLRLLPFASSLAALVLFWKFCSRVLDRRSALLAIAILAASYYPVRHASEIKAYSSDLLVSLILSCLAWAVYRQPRSAGRWAALIASAAMAVWMSLPAAFVVAGVGAFLTADALLHRRWAQLLPVACYGVLAGASFAAMYLLYAGPTARANAWYWEIPTWQNAFPPLQKPWLLPWWLLEIHTGNMLAYPVGGKDFGSTATFLLALAGCVWMWRCGRRALLMLLLSPVAATLLAAMLEKYPYGTSARVALHLAPAFCLLAGAGLAASLRWLAPRRVAPRAVRFAAIAIAMIAVVGLVADVVQPYKRWDHVVTKRTVRELVSHISANDQVIMAHTSRRDANQSLPFLAGTSSAAWRFYLSSLSPAPLKWCVPVDEVQPVAGKTLLIYYAAPKQSDEQARNRLFAAYLKQFESRFGQPRHWRHVMYEPHQEFQPSSVEVYEFGPASAQRSD